MFYHMPSTPGRNVVKDDDDDQSQNKPRLEVASVTYYM